MEEATWACRRFRIRSFRIRSFSLQIHVQDKKLKYLNYHFNKNCEQQVYTNLHIYIHIQKHSFKDP